jgi:hypothetical protein
MWWSAAIAAVSVDTDPFLSIVVELRPWWGNAGPRATVAREHANNKRSLL